MLSIVVQFIVITYCLPNIYHYNNDNHCNNISLSLLSKIPLTLINGVLNNIILVFHQVFGHEFQGSLRTPKSLNIRVNFNFQVSYWLIFLSTSIVLLSFYTWKQFAITFCYHRYIDICSRAMELKGQIK